MMCRKTLMHQRSINIFSVKYCTHLIHSLTDVYVAVIERSHTTFMIKSDFQFFPRMQQGLVELIMMLKDIFFSPIFFVNMAHLMISYLGFLSVCFLSDVQNLKTGQQKQPRVQR